MTLRRAASAVAFAALLVPAALGAADGTTMLGANGEFYRVRTGTYASLFPDAPTGAAANPVLALDVQRNGGFERLLVPGSEGPEPEGSPALTIDASTNHVYLVWVAQVGIHSVLDLISYSADGFGDVFEFAGDAFSAKTNPQLATTLDEYMTLSAGGEVVDSSRTILHLVWFDDGARGQRTVYTPLVIEDGDLLRTNVLFDLEELADDGEAAPATSSTAGLLEKPQIRRGRDGQSVVVGFVAATGGRLQALELRSVTGELVFFADKARSTIIDTATGNPGVSRRAIADKARSTIIDTARRLFRNEVARFLTDDFLEDFANSPAEEPLESVADAARSAVIATGAALRRGIADRAQSNVIEIGESQSSNSINHLLDVRRGVRRELPSVSAPSPRVFVSPTGDDAALAWQQDDTVQYRESTGDGGWSPVRTVSLGATLSVEDAYALVQQRVGSK
jgi:hypothetical protein